MFAHRIASIARITIVAAGIGTAVTIGAAGHAAASTGDDGIVDYAKSIGINIDSPQAVIRAAHGVCTALSDGDSAETVGRVILSQNKISDEQAAEFIVASVDTYCPQYRTLLQG